MSTTTSPKRSPNVFFDRRPRPPPTPADLARLVRSADPANGLAKVEAAGGDHDICYFVVHLNYFGDGRIVIGCHSALDEAEAAALAFARRRQCLFAPSRSFVAVEARELATRTGMTEQAARATVKRWCEGVLRPDIVLPFDDEALAGCTVGDVLADPERFEGETLADPLEGVGYGRCCAKIMRRANGEPWINSFAHGRTIYTLNHDAISVRKAMEASIKGEVAATFALVAAKADLDPIELEELRQLAKTLSGTGLRAINAMLKSAQQQQAASNAQAACDFRASQRQDPRLRIRAPFPDEPWLPQIEVLNEVIGAVEALMPPSRDIDDDMMWVRKLAVPGTHAFTSSEANAETEENDDQAAAAGAMGALQDE